MKRMILSLLMLLSVSLVSHAEDSKIDVLLLSGMNNHDWKTTTPKIQSILEETGLFRIDVTDHPEQLNAETLKKYDVILSNWNVWGKGDASLKEWPEALKEAYVDFVASGGGHVVVHAGGSSHYDWPEYQEIALGYWAKGKTGHGPPHEFEVRIDNKEHPITKGLEDFTINDELWNRVGIGGQVEVLASSFSSKESRGGTGEYEPTCMIAQRGKGRCFALMLGHNVPMMENAGFITLLRRGTQWSATGEVTTPVMEEER